MINNFQEVGLDNNIVIEINLAIWIVQRKKVKQELSYMIKIYAILFKNRNNKQD